jgi:hypothetical protein
MKTPILSTAIAVIAGSVLLGTVVNVARPPRSSKEPPKQEIVNPLQWAMAQHLRTPPKPGELEAYRNAAKNKLDRLNETGKLVERMNDSVAKAEFQMKLPEWQAKFQRVADGDFSDQAAMDIVTASGQWQRVLEKLGGPKQTVTLHAYFQIKDGMAYWEVNQLLGYGGVEQSSAGDLKTYIWQEGFARVVASFERGKLIAKTQAGLK